VQKENEDLSILFDRSRMKIAREMRGITRVQLSRDMGSITPAAIGQFEKGYTRPASRTVERMAVALRVPPHFLSVPLRPQDTDEPVAFFRSIRSTSPGDRAQAVAYAHLAREFAFELERHVVLPHVAVPRGPLGDTADRHEVEQVAAQVRAAWGVGPGPVTNMVRLLESKGVAVIRCRIPVGKMWSFAVAFRDRPVVFADPHQDRCDIDRRDMAHELGHLVMHDAPGKTADIQADQFAAAFLMPADDITGDLPSGLDWPHLVRMKAKWGVSLAALLTRAHTLGVMDDTIYSRGWRALSTRGWTHNEPSDLGSPERPVMFHRAAGLLGSTGVTLDDVLHKGGLPGPDIRIVMGDGPDPRPHVRIRP
jgi:Zn-dependent peptidase ImmA (M78 family)/transcriptional regulator with XRE-family HTH domain